MNRTRIKARITTQFQTWEVLGAALGAWIAVNTSAGQADGFLEQQGRRLFPIGIYEMPATEAKLRAMSEAGINLVRCGDRNALDRATRPPDHMPVKVDGAYD